MFVRSPLRRHPIAVIMAPLIILIGVLVSAPKAHAGSASGPWQNVFDSGHKNCSANMDTLSTANEYTPDQRCYIYYADLQAYNVSVGFTAWWRDTNYQNGDISGGEVYFGSIRATNCTDQRVKHMPPGWDNITSSVKIYPAGCAVVTHWQDANNTSDDKQPYKYCTYAAQGHGGQSDCSGDMSLYGGLLLPDTWIYTSSVHPHN